jgi:hypothetical protein
MTTVAFSMTYKDATYNCTWTKADGTNLPAWFDDFLLRIP